MKKICSGRGKYAVAFSVSVILALILLLLAVFMPQERILGNLWESIDYLRAEGLYPHLADYRDSTRLDNYTDAMMLLESAVTNRHYPGSVLTNPVYRYEEAGENVIELLGSYLNGAPQDSTDFYVRYWMGFRVWLRGALTFLNYFQIRRYLAVGFFALFTAVICNIAGHVDGKLAFAFALSVILVRPYVIVNSMQYCCCFYIMFAAMLLAPRIRRHPSWRGIFFMEIGIVTMYIDFYTVPLITLGFPLVYLCAMERRDGEVLSWKRIGKDIGLWFGGYVLMWLAKLGLTTALTSVNALENGLASLMGRLGVTQTPGLEEYYSLELAMERLQAAIFCDPEGKVIFLGAVAIVAAVVMARMVRGKTSGVKELLPLLVIAALPFAWFLATVQPIVLHHYFQYRIIALTYWAAGVVVYFLLWGKKAE